MTPARQLAGRSRADAGGGVGGPGAGRWVLGVSPVAVRPGQSASRWSAPWVRSPLRRSLVGAEGSVSLPTPAPVRARRALCALEKSAIIRVTHPAFRPSPAHAAARRWSRSASAGSWPGLAGFFVGSPAGWDGDGRQVEVGAQHCGRTGRLRRTEKAERGWGGKRLWS